jgi:hypothetical protein
MSGMYGRDAENILVGNSEGIRTLGKPKRMQKPNAKMNHKTYFAMLWTTVPSRVEILLLALVNAKNRENVRKEARNSLILQ